MGGFFSIFVIAWLFMLGFGVVHNDIDPNVPAFGYVECLLPTFVVWVLFKIFGR